MMKQNLRGNSFIHIEVSLRTSSISTIKTKDQSQIILSYIKHNET